MAEAPPVEPAVAPVAVAVPPPAEIQPELLRLFEVVTSMCDHVIGYIEADRAERQLMMETLAQLGRVITDGAAAAVAAASAPRLSSAAPTPAPIEIPTETRAEPFAFVKRERVIGGSMPAGPDPAIGPAAEPAIEPEIELAIEPAAEPAVSEPIVDAVIDLVAPEPEPESAPSAMMKIAVEVRGRFGDRWVDGFEICEVMTTPAGPRYRLRRHRDGVVLPELFDATNIRHVETFDQLDGVGMNGSQSNRTQSNGTERPGATGYWSRS